MKHLLRALCALLFTIGTAFAAVNVNTASLDELQTVTGIGPTIAQRIIDERRNGPYKSLDDLQARVRGIGETSVRKMAAAGLTVGGGSRAKADAQADPKGGAKSQEKAAAARGDAKGAAVGQADGKGGSSAKSEPKGDAKAGPKGDAKAAAPARADQTAAPAKADPKAAPAAADPKSAAADAKAPAAKAEPKAAPAKADAKP
jgi:competence protein ComEA